MAMEQRRSKNRTRIRFVLTFSIVGALIPVVFVVLSLLMPAKPDWEPNASATFYLYLIQILWPTWFWMLDAERAPEIIYMLVFCCTANAAIYAAVGLLVAEVWWWLKAIRRT
jgi:hypothetical protein